MSVCACFLNESHWYVINSDRPMVRKCRQIVGGCLIFVKDWDRQIFFKNQKWSASVDPVDSKYWHRSILNTCRIKNLERIDLSFPILYYPILRLADPRISKHRISRWISLSFNNVSLRLKGHLLFYILVWKYILVLHTCVKIRTCLTYLC